MLETKFKVAFLLAILAFAALPIMGILRGTTTTPFEEPPSQSGDPAPAPSVSDEAPVKEEMIHIPGGVFLRGTDAGGFDEQPPREIYLSAFEIDKYEVSNHQYAQFAAATGHRKAGPPSRYAKNVGKMRGPNQPVVYISWDDAQEYCRWKGKRLPTEAQWEKAMRGPDGRLWPWGTIEQPNGANWARIDDGYDVTAPVGTFKSDTSPYGVMDGAGNVMEWVEDWYSEGYYRESSEKDPPSPEHGVFRVLRGGGYTTTGGDLRITSRSKMVPDFRDETIGFRCARRLEKDAIEASTVSQKTIGNQSSRESKTRPE